MQPFTHTHTHTHAHTHTHTHTNIDINTPHTGKLLSPLQLSKGEYMCNKIINNSIKNVEKVRDHCHLSKGNFFYTVANEITAILHNGLNKNLCLIIKHLETIF